MYCIHTKDAMIVPRIAVIVARSLENNPGFMTVKRNNLFVSGKTCQVQSP